MKPLIHSPKQAGAALITSLIFLTVLTLLGMSTLGTALLESRMAGNARDRNLAFQAAEAGLRDAELYIRDSGRIVGKIVMEADDGIKDYTGQAGKYGLFYNGATMDANGTDWNGIDKDKKSQARWQIESGWDNAIQYYQEAAFKNKEKGTKGKTVLAVNAGYQAELPTAFPMVLHQPEYLVEPFQKSSDYYYRITVRGYGMRSGTRVMLQEVYKP